MSTEPPDDDALNNALAEMRNTSNGQPTNTTPLPLMLGYRYYGQFIVRCDACNTDHVHTLCCHSADCPDGCQQAIHGDHRIRCTCALGAGDGPRVAHCEDNPDSPYYEHGYLLFEVSREDYHRSLRLRGLL